MPAQVSVHEDVDEQKRCNACVDYKQHRGVFYKDVRDVAACIDGLCIWSKAKKTHYAYGNEEKQSLDSLNLHVYFIMRVV